MNSEPPFIALRWPAHRFWWAILEAELPPSRRDRNARPLSPGLLLALEPELPIPIDEVHAVDLPLWDGRVLACAAARDDLAALSAHVVSLTPTSVPEFLHDEVPADVARRLNVLVGEFAPAPLRARSRRTHALAAITGSLLVAAACLGLIRRAQHWSALADTDDARIAETLRTASSLLPPGSTGFMGDGDLRGESKGTLDPDRLALVVQRQRAVALRQKTLQAPRDAATDLAAILAAWPSTKGTQVHSINITLVDASLALSVEGDPAPLLASFVPPAGWRMDEPRLNASDRLTRVNIVLRPLPHPQAASAPTATGGILP